MWGILERVKLFEGLDEQTLREIGELCAVRHCVAGELLVAQEEDEESDGNGIGLEDGGTSRDLFLLVEGTVNVVARLPEGSEPREVRLDNLDYELLGEIAWVLGSPRSASVYCSSDCVAVRIEGPAFMEYLDHHPPLGYTLLKRMMGVMSRKLQDSNLMLFF